MKKWIRMECGGGEGEKKKRYEWDMWGEERWREEKKRGYFLFRGLRVEERVVEERVVEREGEERSEEGFEGEGEAGVKARKENGISCGVVWCHSSLFDMFFLILLKCYD